MCIVFSSIIALFDESLLSHVKQYSVHCKAFQDLCNFFEDLCSAVTEDISNWCRVARSLVGKVQRIFPDQWNGKTKYLVSPLGEVSVNYFYRVSA